jgi:hypothetical protein
MTLNEKAEFLESMGFDICHGVSDVEHSGFHFDFSATRMEPEAIIYTVIKQVYADGQKFGKEDLQLKLRGLLGCDS